MIISGEVPAIVATAGKAAVLMRAELQNRDHTRTLSSENSVIVRYRFTGFAPEPHRTYGDRQPGNSQAEAGPDGYLPIKDL
ncbi:hypothetical protein [Sinosporangium siamense]|uniref:hypothetical protein n=1 Tax=Sinosporangium siamense TaxID=1367973 RepID=UPI00194DFD8A|nr:hypothetical protein [Sinosporangium siamense]